MANQASIELTFANIRERAVRIGEIVKSWNFYLNETSITEDSSSFVASVQTARILYDDWKRKYHNDYWKIASELIKLVREGYGTERYDKIQKTLDDMLALYSRWETMFTEVDTAIRKSFTSIQAYIAANDNLKAIKEEQDLNNKITNFTDDILTLPDKATGGILEWIARNPITSVIIFFLFFWLFTSKTGGKLVSKGISKI